MLAPALSPKPSVASRAPERNRLLGALPPTELERLRPCLERVQLAQRDILHEPGEQVSYVYFPESAVLSLISTMRSGATVEVGTAGCEGMAGLSVLLAEGVSTVRTLAQIPGATQRMTAEAFARLANEPGVFHRTLLRYTQAFLTQVAQTAACNGAHLVVERCARWLLMTHDRVEGDEFPLTHEFLAFMLGVRRAGVTVAMRTLQDDGLLCYTRGHVRIVDRDGLEGASCECYRVVRAHFERLLPAADWRATHAVVQRA